MDDIQFIPHQEEVFSRKSRLLQMRLIKQHAAAEVLTVVAYMIIAGCDFAQALALVSMYMSILLAIVQADIWIQERKEKRYGRYARGEGGSAGHKEDKVSVKAG